jgi:hypothetical protein
MKYLITLLFLFGVFSFASAQIAKDFMVGGGFDLVKSDNDGFGGKIQVGLEGNYFITRQFTASLGAELWSSDESSLALGVRWFPVEEAFVRARGLIGENDLSVGGGWTKPINEKLKFEAIGDFYFEGEFAIRAGIMYILRRK